MSLVTAILFVRVALYGLMFFMGLWTAFQLWKKRWQGNIIRGLFWYSVGVCLNGIILLFAAFAHDASLESESVARALATIPPIFLLVGLIVTIRGIRNGKI